jgi:hypothetical protein
MWSSHCRSAGRWEVSVKIYIVGELPPEYGLPLVAKSDYDALAAELAACKKQLALEQGWNRQGKDELAACRAACERKDGLLAKCRGEIEYQDGLLAQFCSGPMAKSPHPALADIDAELATASD